MCLWGVGVCVVCVVCNTCMLIGFIWCVWCTVSGVCVCVCARVCARARAVSFGFFRPFPPPLPGAVVRSVGLSLPPGGRTRQGGLGTSSHSVRCCPLPFLVSAFLGLSSVSPLPPLYPRCLGFSLQHSKTALGAWNCHIRPALICSPDEAE